MPALARFRDAGLAAVSLTLQPVLIAPESTCTMRVVAAVAALCTVANGFSINAAAPAVRARASAVSMGEYDFPGDPGQVRRALLSTCSSFALSPRFTMASRPWLTLAVHAAQVAKFEDGTDFLFFQSPAPTTMYQDDLPSFFSGENFSGMEVKPLQIAVTVSGLATAAAVVPVLLS